MNTQPKFDPTFDSLYGVQVPAWFKNAKFGIWSHWGPQSVPMFGDWYARNMYIQDTPQYLYHVRHYGHPSKFGYKDICALWKAEHFDSEGLMKLFRRAGARYFVAQAMHHDHFFNYASKINRMNAVQVGPGKDIVGLWRDAAQKYDMPFGLTEHLSASFTWWKTNKRCDSHGPYKGVPYDGNDPAWRDFYFDNFEHADGDTGFLPWYTQNPQFHEYWKSVMKELIDLYQPDLLYTDGSLPFGDHWQCNEQNPFDFTSYGCGLEIAAYLYNKSIEVHGENRAIYTQKDRREPIYKVGILDVEKSQLSGIAERPWQTDTCIGNWFYDMLTPYKRPEQLIEMLVDIVAKNGTMLLNILQRPDGTIDEDAVYILEEIGKWFAVCGEGIYDTHPYRVAEEGETRAVIDGFREEKTEWTASDLRFTQKGSDVFAFLMAAPENRVVLIKSLMGEQVKKVSLLGYGDVAWKQDFGVVAVKLPDVLPTEYVNCLRVTV